MKLVSLFSKCLTLMQQSRSLVKPWNLLLNSIIMRLVLLNLFELLLLFSPSNQRNGSRQSPSHEKLMRVTHGGLQTTLFKRRDRNADESSDCDIWWHVFLAIEFWTALDNLTHLNKLLKIRLWFMIFPNKSSRVRALIFVRTFLGRKDS